MSDKDIGRIYSESVQKRQFDTISDRFLKEAKMSVKFDDGSVSKFTLDDAYAKSIARRISIESGDIEQYIAKIFTNSGWGTGQDKAMESLKNVTINHNYSKSVDLIKYLAVNKTDLLSLKSIFTEESVIDFPQIIANSLPETFREDLDNLKDFIITVHHNVVPVAATNVGLGEGTFSIFGTAKKGDSGDLQWDGKEVEIKTNGASNAGAVLGGDRTMIQGVINDLQELKGGALKYGGHFYIETLNSILEKLDTVVSSRGQDPEMDKLNIEELKEIANSSIFRTHFKKQPMIDAINDINTIDDLTSGRTKSLKLPKSGTGSTTLYDSLRQYITDKIDKLSARGQNWISQVNTFLALCDTDEEKIEGFSRIRTDGKCDLSKEIKQFFKKYNVNNFLPTVDYDNFSRLIGTIALLCYKNKIGYDIITAGNDKTHTMIFINCDRSLLQLYEHLVSANLPVIFDLDVDVYDMGSTASRAQTVFATAPRIKLL